MRTIGAFLMAVTFLISASARAEITDRSQLETTPGRETSSLRSTISASEESSLFIPWDESIRVSYSEVLQDPDNTELNFRYAQTLIHEGRLKSAVPTLQRILAVQPDLAQVRLLYAVVLYRLDNLVEAEREFEIVLKYQMSERDRAQVEKLYSDIQYKRKDTKFDISLTMGVQYDYNRNAAPKSDTVEFFLSPAPLDLPSRFDDESDFALVTMLNTQVEHDLGFPEKHKLIASMNLYDAEQAELDEYDLMAGEVAFGGLYHSRYLDIKPMLFYNRISLSRESYIQSGGIKLELSRAFDEHLRMKAIIRSEYQDYNEIRTNPLAELRDGMKSQIEIRGDYTINAFHQIGLGLSYLDKNAAVDWYEYNGPGISLAHTWLPRRNHFLITKIDFEEHKYHGPDLFITRETRRDRRLRGRVIYGATLGGLFGEERVPGPLRDVVASISAEYFMSYSNIRNYEYENKTAAILFTKRWKL